MLRPLTGEPLPLDLLNTTWIAGGEHQDLLADEAGMRAWLDEHGFDAPSDAPARHALRETREALRALLLARGGNAARAGDHVAPAGGAGDGGTTTGDGAGGDGTATGDAPGGGGAATGDGAGGGGAAPARGTSGGGAGPARDTSAAEAAAIEAVNAVLARGGRHPLLTPGGLEYEVVAANAWRVPWACAAALVELLDQRGDRVKGCANSDCILWFLDTTRPGTRRWCSMAACGNRDKAIRHGRVRRR